MKNWLLFPPIAFGVILVFGIILSLLSSKLAARSTSHPKGKIKPYACGEDIDTHRMQPDYSYFFPFAFFTIMHVAALLIATVPSGIMSCCGIAALYVIAIITALFILYRK